MNEKPLGVEVSLKSPEDFLKVKETLTRCGIASRRSKTLYQSCHILHKRGKYYIIHFKELFLLDGKEANFDVDDFLRRNLIVKLLTEWGLVAPVHNTDYPHADMSRLCVVKHSDKAHWNLIAKYQVGVKRRVDNANSVR
jgi:hypothetical protein